MRNKFENNNNEVAKVDENQVAKVDENPNANNPVNLLPSDILQSQITNRLGTEDVFSLNATCRFFRNFFKSEKGKPVFQRAYNVKFHLELLVEKMGKFTQGELSPVKCVFVGNSAALKGAVLDCYAPSRPKQTIGVDFCLKTIQAGGATLKIQLWDTAGQERYKTLSNPYLRGAHVAVCVLDPSQNDFSANVHTWLEEIGRAANAVNAANPPIKLLLSCHQNYIRMESEAFQNFSATLREKFGNDLLCHQVTLDKPATVKNALDGAIGLYIEKRCLPALESAQKLQIEEATKVVEEGAGKCLLM